MGKKHNLRVVAYSGEGGLPSGADIFYLCLLCRTVVSSAPAIFTSCLCRNVSVDTDAGRGGARDVSSLIVLSMA